MNGVLAVVIAVLIYPGILVALVAALLLSWGRASARAALSGAPTPSPTRGLFARSARFAGAHSAHTACINLQRVNLLPAAASSTPRSPARSR